MDAFVTFMNGVAGRAARVIVGLVLVYIGLALAGGPGGAVLALIGLVPLAMGLWGRCLIEFA